MSSFTVPPIDYSSRDYVSIREDLIRTLRILAPEYTNIRPSDPGIVILELVAMAADVLHFYADRALLEGYVDTAVTRESLVRLGRLIDYLVPGPSASSGEVTMTLSTPHTGPSDLTIAKGFPLITSGRGGIQFETAEPVTFSTGEFQKTVSVVQGTTLVAEFISNGNPNQRLFIDELGVADGSHLVSVDETGGLVFNGVEWSEVESLAFSSSSSTHYEIDRDDRDRITVILGDNTNGKIPPSGSKIQVRFLSTLGDRGNVGAGKISGVSGQVEFDGTPVSISVINDGPTTGGSASPSIEEIRRSIPRSIRTLSRAVTIEDFRNLSEAFPGVGAARAFSAAVSDNPYRCGVGVKVAVADSEGANLSTLAKSNLLSYLNDRKMLGTSIEIVDGRQVFIDANIHVFYKQGFTQDIVESEVDSALDQFFTLGRLTFGQTVYLSELFYMLASLDSISYVQIDKFTRRVIPVYLNWNGDGELEWVEPAGTSVNEKITITLTSPTTFSVLGSVSGLQPTSGSFGATYRGDSSCMTLLLSNSGDAHPAPSPGVTPESLYFYISPRAGHIELQEDEIPIMGDFEIAYTQVRTNIFA